MIKLSTRLFLIVYILILISCKKNNVPESKYYIISTDKNYEFKPILIDPQNETRATQSMSTSSATGGLHCQGTIYYRFGFVYAGPSSSEGTLTYFRTRFTQILQMRLSFLEPGQITANGDYLNFYNSDGHLATRLKQIIIESFRLTSDELRIYPQLDTYNMVINQLYISCTDDSGAPTTPGGYGGGSGGPYGNGLPFSKSTFETMVYNQPFSLLPDIPCLIVKQWLDLVRMQYANSVYDKLNYLATNPNSNLPSRIKPEHIARIQTLDRAHSQTINLDNFSINVQTLPVVNGVRLTPTQFLEYIRLHINGFTGGKKIFEPYNYNGINDINLWFSSNPVGAIMTIDIPGPDNGSVITTESSPNHWVFTTIFEPMFGAHPVSGNREFGYKYNLDGSTTFYTRGIDRLTTFEATWAQGLSGIPFNQADDLWSTFQSRVKDFVNTHEGNSTVMEKQTNRPNWETVRKVANGTLPLSTLSRDCPD